MHCRSSSGRYLYGLLDDSKGSMCDVEPTVGIGQSQRRKKDCDRILHVSQETLCGLSENEQGQQPG